jgi:Putative Se/S carrier protein-like
MKIIFLFPSVHRVLQAEKLLKGKGIDVDLIPVPREIHSDCGIAMELSSESEERALMVFKENEIFILESFTRDSIGRFEKRGEIPPVSQKRE